MLFAAQNIFYTCKSYTMVFPGSVHALLFSTTSALRIDENNNENLKKKVQKDIQEFEEDIQPKPKYEKRYYDYSEVKDNTRTEEEFYTKNEKFINKYDKVNSDRLQNHNNECEEYVLYRRRTSESNSNPNSFQSPEAEQNLRGVIREEQQNNNSE